MRLTFGRYRRGAVILGTVACASMLALGISIPAEAATVAPGNTVLNGGGSQTTYTMMQQLSDLYSSAPGCQLITSSSSTQELDYACASSYATAEPGNEEGYTFPYSPLNPYNDVVYQEAPLGSSNGIKELELEGADTPTSPPNNDIAEVDFARSSRAAIPGSASTDDKAGLNFVSYAADAVPWWHLNKTHGFGANDCTYYTNGTTIGGAKTSLGTKTPSDPNSSDPVSNPDSDNPQTGMTNTQLTGIYDGSITNWNQVGGYDAPIDVFIAQSGSGTESTWAGDLGLTGNYPYAGATSTASRLGLPATDFEIFENEVGDIYSVNDANLSDQIACDAIFFFSFGKYSILCPGNECTGTPTSSPNYTGTKSQLGEINGTKATETTIECQFSTCPAYYTDRQLYNVYSDGSNSNLPFASSSPGNPTFENQAIMNFVSTYGFLCNPATAADVDPLSPTGATYGSEIDGIIEANGFFPDPSGTMGDSSIATPPVFTNANYAAASPTPPGDTGTCRVTTTDNDGNN
jgi:ABC-type phosphate transport system substrate-binding protein